MLGKIFTLAEQTLTWGTLGLIVALPAHPTLAAAIMAAFLIPATALAVAQERKNK